MEQYAQPGVAVTGLTPRRAVFGSGRSRGIALGIRCRAPLMRGCVVTREADPGQGGGPADQSVAHSWRATDRFVPRVIVRPLQSLMAVETSSAALILVATVGGMVVPALIYVAFNLGGTHLHGWGIPMATDIAFAVAVLTSLGSRVPIGARLFLLTLAIVDDLGAILVIAVFYSGGISFLWLLAAVSTVLVAVLLQRARVRALWVFIALGCAGWFALHESGVHATIIGVAFGLITPAYALLSPKVYPDVATSLVAEVVTRNEDGTVSADEYEANDHTLREIRRLSLETQSPLHRVETRLAPYVAFGIVPLFAFANAGLSLPEVPASEWATDPVVLGIALGLVLGKTVGIFGAAWLLVRTGFARYPTGMTQTHLLGVSMTAGVGFTVAIFVATLAFEDADVIDLAKLGIMLGSLVAAVGGYLILRAGGTSGDTEQNADRL